MLARCRASFLVLFAAAALGLISRTAAAQAPPPMTVTGRVVAIGPAPPPEAVPCCTVRVELTPAAGDPNVQFGTTGLDGTFAVPVECIGRPPYVVVATAECCGATSEPQTVDSCLDPMTGLPRTVDVGDLECTTTPVTGMTALHGNVVCRSGLFLEPVADCGLLVRNAVGRPVGTSRTDAAGDWELCVECVGTTTSFIVEALCCGLTQDVPADGCPLSLPVETFVCDECAAPPCAVPSRVELRGSVTCPPEPGGTDPTPWPDCPVTVQLRDACTGDLVEEHDVVSGSDGTWTLCVDCPGDGSCPTWTVTTISSCCPSQEVTTVDGCPPFVELPPNACDPMSCAGVAGCAADEKEVRGRVTCADPLSPTGRQPMAGCEVIVEGQGCIDADGDTICETECPTVTTFTDADGNYSVCLPCAECSGVVVTASCCGARRTEPLPVDCGTTTTVDLDCGECGTTGGPCGPDARQVSGFVTCLDSTGGSEPVPGCGVRLTCAATPAEAIAWTDEDGFYSACLDCLGCDVLIAEALCCGAVQTITDPDCFDVRQDFECTGCEGLLGHCPGPPAVRARGQVRCVQSSGATPLSGCDVTLVGVPAGGGPLVTVTTRTDGAGWYEECVPCEDPTGLETIVATAECCGVETTTPVDGCPTDVELLPLDCPECSPCPEGHTRLQGRVHCRGAGAVADCTVRVLIDTCEGTEMFELTTDSEGKYRACVPCPCPGTTITVTALCCGATRSLPVIDCGPVTPVPTLACPVPCR